MPWNEPGSSGDNSGGGRKPNGRSAGRAGDTPDLEDVIQSVRKRFGGSGGGSGHSGG
ncbi:MAG TPA: protease modulator HflK, partial [Gammaproteobacteria bacterium]|nr:protease modulator HflK [Gammaproteobacteria bacterium]